MEVEKFSTKADFLQHCAKVLLERYPKSASYRFVSEKVGISPSSFQRMAKKETKAPNFYSALKVVQSVCDNGKVKQFIEKFYPEMLSTYEEIYPGNSEVSFAPLKAEEFFKDAVTYELMLFISSVDDLSRQDVAKKFGEKGLDILDDLAERGLVEGPGKLSVNGAIKLSQDVTQALLQNLIRNNYDLKSFGEKDNWLSVQWNSINLEKAMPVLREACVKMVQEAREVLNDPEYKGDDVVWVGAVMDTLLRTSNKKREKNDNSQQGGLIQ